MALREKQVGGKSFVLDFDFEKVVHALQPEIKDLPDEDKKFFRRAVKFLIGKEIRLSNLSERKAALIQRRVDHIVHLMQYPQILNRDYVRYQLVKLLARLGLPLSIDALGFKFGPMSYQFKTEQSRHEVLDITKTDQEVT